jgi:hypothetical protein
MPMPKSRFTERADRPYAARQAETGSMSARSPRVVHGIRMAARLLSTLASCPGCDDVRYAKRYLPVTEPLG